ncbi:MAG: hypothetical protein GY865_19365 [candidate division Zixibacteria bacterium]|nr:hypothetical protein [candidate division Zixibacteria bacterium]
MIDTKLILIEGMAGSGKSTTGQKLLDVHSINNIRPEFYHEFSNNHPIINYSEPDINHWINQTIQRWSNFVDNILKENKIVILDAALFQCTIGELLEKGAKEIEIYKYAYQILDIIKPLNPTLIYFYQDDIVSSLHKVYESRSQKWQNKICTFLDDTAFGKNNNQTDYELYLKFNKVLRKITDEIFEQTTISKIAIENSEPSWPDIYKKLNEFLQI